MDLHLKQWRIGQEGESEHPTSAAKIPKLIGIADHQPQQQQSQTALPLFAPEPTTIKLPNLSAFSSDSSSRFPKMGSYFSLAQWQELELQALIYRYILAGAAVPLELLHPIKKSLLHSPPYYLHHPLQHYPPPYQPAWYWGRAAMDPEPGRCRRTDGKKWRCSRDVVAGHKYCERHMHRGRNRSRKPVEIPTPTSATSTASLGIGGDGGGGALRSTTVLIGGDQSSLSTAANPTSFVFSGSPHSSDLLHLNQSSSDSRSENKNLFETDNKSGNKSDGHILRHFFDDWPRSLGEPESSGCNASPMSSATCLSISMPENSSSDVSLKLSTGHGDAGEVRSGDRENRGQPQLSWAAGWAANQMGGPLAEALRSAGSNASPTSVLHQLSRGSHVSI